MDQQMIIHAAEQFIDNSPGNLIQKEFALSDVIIGTKIFERPLIGFSSANDPIFLKLKEPAAIGAHFLLPDEWLYGVKSVISFFLPFTKKVKESNQLDHAKPSHEWFHGRIEGQKLVNSLAVFLCAELERSGYPSLVPAVDPRFKWGATIKINEHDNYNEFTSNWSERHAAFIAGLGTFGLSKGLITKVGIAGRIGSVITQLELPASRRDYSEIYEYCSNCGECVRNCPVNAITIENGKNHPICNDYLEELLSMNRPYYGCGKCQVNVSCENGIP